jgi:divalent metal cation (Fe/Co/Zn/Cd) transporter
MDKFISIAVLIAGLILLYFGYSETQSVTGEVSEAVTGQPTDNAIWFIIGGAVLAIIGIGGLIRGMGRGR